jgi:hypothetical protein
VAQSIKSTAANSSRFSLSWGRLRQPRGKGMALRADLVRSQLTRFRTLLVPPMRGYAPNARLRNP